MKLPLLPHGTIRVALCTHSAIKDFTLWCVIKRVFLLVALQSQTPRVEYTSKYQIRFIYARQKFKPCMAQKNNYM